MLKWLTKQWADIKGHAKWDLAITLCAASTVALAAILWQSLKHTAIDRYLFGILFLLSASLFFTLVRKIPSPTHSAKRTDLPTPIPSEPLKLVAEAKADEIFDGELQRVFIYPRIGIPYKMLQEAWQTTKHTDAPKVDCDILLAAYVVNVSASTQYVRDFTASVEVGGERKNLRPTQLQLAPEFSQRSFQHLLFHFLPSRLQGARPHQTALERAPEADEIRSKAPFSPSPHL